MHKPRWAKLHAPAKKLSADRSAWRSLCEAYHHVLKQSPSPEAAKIAINGLHRNGKLRWRCTLREHKARPELRLAPGQSPPPAKPVVTRDYRIPATERFSSFDWERSYATGRDTTSKSHFEFDEIEVHWGDLLAGWPEAEPKVLTRAPRIWPGPEDPQPDNIEPLEWQVMRARAELERKGIQGLDTMRKSALDKLMLGEMWPGAKFSPSTRYKALRLFKAGPQSR